MAEDILDGIFCEVCGVYLGDGEGFPQRCQGCGGNAKESKYEEKKEVEDYRMVSTKKEMLRLGFNVEKGPDQKSYTVKANGKRFNFWPYTGYFAGPSKGRGFKNLLKAIGVAEKEKK